mmetsp:Transcript_22168/g.39876  ORF Transcript_22168/g.39876 Transcript_22168/m.39876 type:complete len:432 (-) Transcript_22168:355-1650(-)
MALPGFKTDYLSRLGLAPSRSEAGLSRALAVCQKLMPQNFVNGVLVFYSEDIMEVLHAHAPLARATLTISSKFDTSEIIGAIQAWQQCTYGVVVIDGSEATIGMVRSATADSLSGAVLIPLSRVTSNIASRTRRGGQSAPRFARARQNDELAFLRKVAATVSDELKNARGLVLGGKADVKRKLLAELPDFLRFRVQQIVDIDAGSGFPGLLMTARAVTDAAVHSRRLEVTGAVAHFMDLVSNGADLVCYGAEETAAALQLAAVEVLLVSSSLDRCRWDDLAATSGAQVIVVSSETEMGHDFDTGFRVGAVLRWKVDAQLLETGSELAEVSHAEHVSNEVKDRHDPCHDADSDTSTTISAHSDAVLLQWLEEVLKLTVDDASAESLAICAGLLLFSEEGSLTERVTQTQDMLRAEGIPEDVLMEVKFHATDL